MASKRRLRRIACEGKKQYKDVNIANIAAGKAAHRAEQWIRAYKCEFCGRWHIGHPPQRIRQSIRDKRGW
jgi:hypothetical protein